jgi:hypothetical protein
MDHKEFKDKLKEIGISQKGFAQMVGYGYSTVKEWENVPKWVVLALGYIEIRNKLEGIDFATNVIEELKKKVQEVDTELQAKEPKIKRKTTAITN